MKRREFISLLAGAASLSPMLAVMSARAQQPGKNYCLGLLSIGSAIGPNDERRRTFVEGLAARGFFEGQNLVLEQRFADTRPSGSAVSSRSLSERT
jgi:hypothetical protein